MDLLKEYLKAGKDRTAIPMYEVMGNKIFVEKFNQSPFRVYEYCLIHNKTWQEVLEFKFDPKANY